MKVLSLIKKIKTMTEECSICFECLPTDKNFLITECYHKFHYSCFKKWEKDTCPMCRQSVTVDSNDNIVNHLSDLFASESTDKKTLILYLEQYCQNIIKDVPSMYKSLILYNTKLLVDIMDDPVDYILEQKLYTLLPFYKYKDYKDELIRLDDVNLVNYIQFDDDTLYDIVSNNCINLLNHVIDNDICTIDSDKVYSIGKLDSVLQPVNLLGVACFLGHVNLLPVLTKYIDINSVNVWNCNALYPAITREGKRGEYNNLKIVKWLVQHGIDVNMTHICNNSPLYYAIETKNFSIVYYLLNNGATVTEKHIFACVAYSDNIHLLKKLLSLLPTLDLKTYKSVHLCCNRSANNYKHINEKYCWCMECNSRADLASLCHKSIPSIFQQACYSKKYEMILLLLSLNKNIKNYKADICTIHNSEWYKKTESTESQRTPYGQTLMDNDLKKIVYINKYETEMKDISDYIWTIIERDDHVSYKHQRKIVKKLVCEMKNKIQSNFGSGFGSGFGLYRSFLYG